MRVPRVREARPWAVGSFPFGEPELVVRPVITQGARSATLGCGIVPLRGTGIDRRPVITQGARSATLGCGIVPLRGTGIDRTVPRSRPRVREARPWAVGSFPFGEPELIVRPVLTHGARSATLGCGIVPLRVTGIDRRPGIPQGARSATL